MALTAVLPFGHPSDEPLHVVFDAGSIEDHTQRGNDVGKCMAAIAQLDDRGGSPTELDNALGASTMSTPRVSSWRNMTPCARLGRSLSRATASHRRL